MANSKRFLWLSVFCLMIVALACQGTWHEAVVSVDAARQCEIRQPEIKPAEETDIVYQTYPVIVDCDKSPYEMILAGRYDLMNKSEFSVANFGSKCKGKMKVELFLISLGHTADDRGATRDLGRLGFKPAGNELMLAFGAKYPNEQTEFPIVALGSNLNDRLGRHYVNFLDSRYDGNLGRLIEGEVWGKPKRVLHLFTEVEPNYEWSEVCRFLSVRKPAR